MISFENIGQRIKKTCENILPTAVCELPTQEIICQIKQL